MDELQCKIQQVMRQVSAAAVYREEPILRPVGRNHLPQKYLEMRALARIGKGGAALFYEQARFMEAQEDEFEYHGDFFAYYPTFLHMGDDQLRGYFSWRTKVRRGVVEETSLSYVFVYIYELLHLVGVRDAAEGYRALKTLWDKYRQYTSKLDWYMELWIHDFVIYYGLEQEERDERSEAMEALIHPEKGAIFGALCALSSYHIERSKFYKVCPIDVEVLSERVYLRFSEYYAKHRSTSLEEHLFGKLVEMPYYMFQSAVFADPHKEDREYVLSDLCRYRCQAGRWFCTRLSCGRNTGREIGMLLKCVDLVLRERAGFEPLKDPKLPKYLRAMVEKEADAFLEEKRETERRRVRIDLGKLQGIRRASDLTRERLLVEEEVEAEAPPPIQNDTALEDEEYRFLQRFLYTGAVEVPQGSMLSVLIDSINEKLYDEFCDTVILCDGDTPELVEDYIEDLKGMIRL